MKKFKEITEKMGRQLKDPKKEVMVVKKVGGKDKVITIDKSQEKDYLSKGWKLAEGKVKELQMKRQDMAKLASLYSKAMKAMPGSPAQKKLKKEIDQYRRELGMNEEMNHMYEGKKRINIGGTDKKGGMMFIGPTGIKKMIELSKKNPSIEYTVKSDNYGDFKAHWLKNGKFAKQTVANINYDFARNAVRGAPKGKTVQDTIFSLMYQVNEAVSPAQQAAIAISKKEKGEKPKTECADEKDFKPHMMYDPKTGKGVKANTYADHVKYDKMGYTHEKPEVKESRAYRDAMRSMKRGGTKGMATTKKDRDDGDASDDDRKAASKNIIMQLRKAADLNTGAEIDFERGKGKVTRDQAKATLARFNALAKPNEKERFQKSIKSLADIKKLLGR